jgi:hypothetical protein
VQLSPFTGHNMRLGVHASDSERHIHRCRHVLGAETPAVPPSPEVARRATWPQNVSSEPEPVPARCLGHESRGMCTMTPRDTTTDDRDVRLVQGVAGTPLVLPSSTSTVPADAVRRPHPGASEGPLR